MNPLVVEFTLLDNSGTLNVEITTKKDFDSGKKLLYRVPTPEVYDITSFKEPVTKTLDEFVKVQSDT